MKRILGSLTVAAFAGMLFAASAFAQSSGSFNYSAAANTACVLNNNNTGSISGGVKCGPLTTNGGACTTTADCTGTGAGATCVGAIACLANADCPTTLTGGSGTCTNGLCVNTGECGITCTGSSCPGGQAKCVGSTDVTIKTSSGSDNVFVVRPSAVVGLLTDVTVSSKQISSASGSTSSSALAGVDFQVNVTSGPAGNKTTVTPTGNITYDARFIQISTNLFTTLSECTAAAGCFITFNESTVSAHSFDWVASNLSSGDYDLTATWTSSLGDFGIGDSMTCVGPVNFTVEQNKIFKPSTGIAF
jgi:hypothetical protein